jgi:hypothetical protein
VFTPPGIRNLEPATSAAAAMRGTMINHIKCRQEAGVFELSMIVSVLRVRVCTLVYSFTIVLFGTPAGWITAYHVVFQGISFGR